MQETYHIAHHQSLRDNQGGRPSNVVSGCATGVRLSVLLPLLDILLQWQKLTAQSMGNFCKLAKSSRLGQNLCRDMQSSVTAEK
jgi:hypothetical protein